MQVLATAINQSIPIVYRNNYQNINQNYNTQDVQQDSFVKSLSTKENHKSRNISFGKLKFDSKVAFMDNKIISNLKNFLENTKNFHLDIKNGKCAIELPDGRSFEIEKKLSTDVVEKVIVNKFPNANYVTILLGKIEGHRFIPSAEYDINYRNVEQATKVCEYINSLSDKFKKGAVIVKLLDNSNKCSTLTQMR